MEERGRSALVQEKIRQMVQNRKKVSTREGGDPLKRLKSDLQPNSRQGDPGKQRPSVRMRPRTSDRPRKDEAHSVTTDSSNRSEVDAPQLIQEAFERGFELSKFLSRSGLGAEESQARLSSDGLFHTLLASRLKGAGEEEQLGIAEREVIAKLQRIQTIEKQQRNCQVAEQRISSLIDARLKALSQF